MGLLLDLVALCGVGLVVYGVSLLSVPAAFIAAGAAVSTVGVLAAQKVSKL